MSIHQSSDAAIVPDALSADAPISKGDTRRRAEQYVALGHQVSQRGLLVEAEVYYRKAIELIPEHAMAHNNLGWTRQMLGDRDGAVANYQRALQLHPHLRIARRNLALLLVRLGRRDESFSLWHEELLDGSEGLAWMQNLVSNAMRSRDLRLAGEYAAILAELRWASPWYPQRRDESVLPLPVRAPAVFLTIPKLHHDIEQFEYLQSRGVLGDELTPIIENYQRVIDRLAPRGIDVRNAARPRRPADNWPCLQSHRTYSPHTARAARILGQMGRQHRREPVSRRTARPRHRGRLPLSRGA